jgi:hypothetical protein
MSDAVTLLRELRPDPSDEPPDEATLERLLLSVAGAPALDPRRTTERVPAVRRPRRRRRALIAVPVAAALLVAIAVAVNNSSPGGGLVAKAYAATNPGDEIVHEVAVRTWAGKNQTETREAWWRASDGAARLVTSDGRASVTTVVDGRGVVRQSPDLAPDLAPRQEVDGDGMTVIADPKTDPSAAFAHLLRGVTSQFRESYPADRLHDDGMTSFEGRAARAYSYNGWLTFYIDPDTAQLLGSRERDPYGPSSDTVTTVITSYEKLPATAENLTKLR